MDRTWAIENHAVNPWGSPDQRPRLIVDASGVEWEVYDESTWSLELALEWDFLPQSENPGLIFSSHVGRRRLWPCPAHWKSLPNDALIELLTIARETL